MKISADCINQDHEALGTHTIDCEPLNEACLFPTDAVCAWAKSQPKITQLELDEDQARHEKESKP